MQIKLSYNIRVKHIPAQEEEGEGVMASGSTCQTERVDEEKKSSEPQNSNSSKSGFQPTVSISGPFFLAEIPKN